MTKLTMTAVRNLFYLLLMTTMVAIFAAPQATAQRGTIAQNGTGKFTTPGLSDLLGNGPTSRQITVKARYILDQSQTKGYLQVQAKILPNWHVYSTTQPKGIGAPLKTKFVLADSPDYTVTGHFVPDKDPNVKNLEYVSVPIEEHSGDIVWSAPIEFTSGVDATQLTIRGEIDGQVCEENGVCLPLSQVDTTFTAVFDASTVAPSAPVADGASIAGDSANAANPIIWSELVKYILYGFAGGMILNLMPCVLPVIGLKIMSFTSQAGQSRGKVVALNLYFVAGIVSVFLALAALAAFLGWGWGQQFQRPEFSIVLVAIVFVFALSFLGVWEIPIPGFVGSSTVMGKAESEGAIAAFLKGILTTLLATPCGGPLIGTTLTWALVQPKPVVFATFASMGIGMGTPYLAISMFPKLINVLPKPGAWMDTFKQVMGFVLLATVVWVFSFLNEDYFVPTLALLFVLWAACWWINRTPLTAEFGERIKSYATAGLFAAVVGFFAFRAFLPSAEGNDYSELAVASLREKGATVLVDFTADW